MKLGRVPTTCATRMRSRTIVGLQRIQARRAARLRDGRGDRISHNAAVSAQTAILAAAGSTGRRFDFSVAIPSALAALLGLACGVSSFLNAYYDLAVFGW